MLNFKKRTNMKHLIFSIFSLFFMFLSSGCMDLNKEPLDVISDQVVFENEDLTKAYLYKIYAYMPCGYGIHINNGAQINSGLGITDLLDGSTDLLRSPSSWNESNSVMIPGVISATYNPFETWNRSYEVIRKVNNLINGLTNSSLSNDFKNRITAEARFVRAFMYFDLVRRYGDVPLIIDLQDFNDLDGLLVSRTQTSIIYDFIDQELSEIGEILPSSANLPASELGRATCEAAWALNGRSLLYAQRYDRSALFSKKVIDSQNYTLDPDYNALFQSHGGNKEVIFEVLFDGLTKGHPADLLYMPPSLDNGWGSQTNPTQELVDSYEMLNGKGINDPSSGYDPNNPYVGRDSRLAASIIYDSAVFKGKVIRTAYLKADDGLGLIGRTYTGYYIRKFLDESLVFEKLNGYGGSSTSWKEIRLGEVLLNYAEAQNEANNGPDVNVYSAINQVRNRANLPDLPTGLTKEQMKEKIIQERKVELAFEGHRFWDLRRWKLAESVLNNKYFHGMKITDVNGVKTFERFELNMLPKQVFLPKHYLMPINQAELEKNPNLGGNNPGY